MAGPINPRLLREAGATRGFIIGVGATGVAQSFLVIAQATIIAATVTHVFDSHNTDGVWTAVGWLLLVFAARGVLTWLTSVLAHRASAGVKSSLRRRVLAARLANPGSQTSTASIVTIMTSGLDAIDAYFGKYLPQFLLSATVPIIVGVAVAMHDLTSMIIIIVTVPLIPIFMVLIGRTTQTQVARRFKVQLRLANHFADLVAGLPTLQVFGRARAQAKGLAASEGESRRHTMGTLRVAFLSAGVLELFATLSVALIAVTIGFRVLAGDLDLNTALYVLVLA
ncbi:MAG: ABC transporter transmembrane domain-containing protein, partial [Propionibacteriaceae bacterium]|nr:ABC transporter transmembrane domain-containing protein [Propionibacteriaceae bacterium]